MDRETDLLNILEHRTLRKKLACFILYNSIIVVLLSAIIPWSWKLQVRIQNFYPFSVRNLLRLQSFVMDKPEIETITEKSQPGSVLSGIICILNWSHLMGEASSKHISAEWNQTALFLFFFFLSENAKSPSGKQYKGQSVVYKLATRNTNQWFFFLVKSSDRKGSGCGLDKVKAIVFRVCRLCSPGPTFSRPWTLTQTPSGKGRSLLKLVRKAILWERNCSGLNIVLPAPNHVFSIT